MSTSPDALAVVRAAEALTTQVRRIADALTTPVAERTDDGPTTSNGPHCVCGDPIERWTGPGTPGWIHSPGSDTPCTDARPAPADDEQTLRWARRESLLVLLTRLQRGRTLTGTEANALRQHVETEIREADTARHQRNQSDDAARRALEQRQEMAAERYALQERAESAERDRDGAYRERAQLLALLASLHPSVIAPAPDVAEPEWQILYLRIGGRQASWHIAPRDAELLAHVEHVPVDDSRAQWDGHTTEEKYARIGEHAARLYAEARGRAEVALDGTEPTTEG